MLSPHSGRISYPDDLLSTYQDELGPYRVAPSVQYKEGNEEAFLADLVDLVEQRGKYALRLMADHRPDFMMVHFQATDVLQHACWKLVDPSHPRHDAEAAAQYGPEVRRVFERVDHYVGRMLEHLDDDTTVIVMSDHGFGLLHLKKGVFTRLRAGLFRAGLTPSAVWHLIEKVGLQNYVWLVSKSTRNKVVSKFLSFDDVDWSRTVAYSMGHVGQVYINLKGREPHGIVEPGEEYLAARQRVIDALQALRHPQTGEPLVDQVIRGDEVVHGPHAHQTPDLHLVLDGYRVIAFPLFAADGRLVTRQIRGDSGSHRRHGVLMAWGPEVRAGHQVAEARIVDLAPTILHLMGLPVPADMDGRALTGMLASDRAVEVAPVTEEDARAETGLSATESSEVEERLRSLGYLG
jgi:predicted AlkP superfamily phosphohydrolase/phosphomutase